MMIVLGLTGSIGMGKSTVAAMMETMRIPVHDADACVHSLLEPDSPARPALAAAFPYFDHQNLYDKKTKTLKRKELGALVFKDASARERLESILHPLVRKSQLEFLRASQRKGVEIACLDIPLLFEKGADQYLDYTLSVSAPYNIQRQRVLARPGMTETRFQAILQTQMPDTEKRTLADYVIPTGAGRAYTMQALKSALLNIRAKETPPAPKKIAEEELA